MSKVMTSIEFVNESKDIASNYKTLYVMGCFGAPMNATNKKRYTNNNAYNKKRAKMINSASSDTFGFDCVCLIKGILWGWNGNLKATYGGAKYCSNGVPDFGTEEMLNYCTNVSNNFKTIEVGELLWLKGHAGIYIGDGLAVECTPKWQNKVQITAVKNIGTKKGYNARKWTKHGKCNFIDYIIDPFLAPKGYFTLGNVSPNIGKIATFMYKTFPAYTSKKALGNLYGKYLQSSITEFQKRTKIPKTKNIDETTIKELEKYGFKK